MSRFSSFALAIVMAFALTACDSSTPAPTPTPTPTGPAAPVINVTSISNPNTQQIAFAFRSDVSVTFSEIIITNPLGETTRLTGDGTVFGGGINYEFNDVFTRLSGTWSFRFTGNRSPSVTNGNFDVTSTVNVSAFAPGQPSN